MSDSLLQEIKKELKKRAQNHLLAGLELFSPAELQKLWQQLQTYSPELLIEQRAKLREQPVVPLEIEPLAEIERQGSLSDRQIGESLMQAGKVGCILLAGGQGSRLGGDRPKGTIEVSCVKKKSLFQLFCEKTKAASVRAGRDLPLAIMTSPLNHKESLRYLEEHRYFGLKKEQVALFSQGMLPFLDEEGNWLLGGREKCLAEGPDGNGSVFKHFSTVGPWSEWKAQGVEYVLLVLIDNPLADPFDAEFCGFHVRKKAEVSVKAVERKEGEKMGLIVRSHKKLKVVEYTEMPASAWQEQSPDGTLRWNLGNTSLFCFSAPFIEKVREKSLPWHRVWKKASIFSLPQGLEERGIWKFETFIFDLLPFAEKSAALLYPRALSYAPLKNATGEDSLDTVRRALLEADRRVYTELSGLPSPQRVFELEQAFYYPTPLMREKWRQKPLPDEDYIESNCKENPDETTL